jgi:septal ring factor EnvC (AmiA/AmiB activator)
VSEGLQEVQKRVQEAPQLMSIPNDLKDLSNNVAALGSQITEMKSTTKQLQLQTGDMSSNLTQLQVS